VRLVDSSHQCTGGERAYFPIARRAFEANCRRQVTITTKAVVANKAYGLTNQPR
jgi:hypothetical protein